MQQPNEKNAMNKKDITRRHIAQWAILAVYLAIIWWMGSKYWGVTRVAEFVTIFIVLSFVVLIAYRALEPKENRQ